MKLGKRGQGTMDTILTIPVVVISLLVFFALLGPILQSLDEILIGTNSSIMSNVATIRLVLGFIGLIVVMMALIAIVNAFRRPRFPAQEFA